MSIAAAAIETLRDSAQKLLADGTLGVVIGYGKDGADDVAGPLFVRNPEDASKLIFDESCVGNLAIYLSKPEVRKLGRIGIVVKGCDLRAVNVLMREHVIDREQVYIFGVHCDGVGNPKLAKCNTCDVHNPMTFDEEVGDSVEQSAVSAQNRRQSVDEFEGKSLEDRWAFWSAQMDKCVRCYACRQVCPMCYCKRCIVEKNEPQWIDTSSHRRGNLAWNVVRAFHLTGRCVSCGECERVCPMNIPLGLLNQKLSALVEEWFDFRSGLAAEENAPFTCWDPDDPEKDIM